MQVLLISLAEEFTSRPLGVSTLLFSTLMPLTDQLFGAQVDPKLDLWCECHIRLAAGRREAALIISSES